MQIIRTLFLLLTLNICAQEKNIFFQEIEKKTKQYNNVKYFKVTSQFYKNKEWDSTLVYSYKLLNTTKNKEIIDYTHYFRAHSFKKKNLLKEALKEYNLISSNFIFYCHVKSALAELSLEQNEYAKALIYFYEIEKNTDAFCELNKSALYHNIGLCHFHLSQFEKAETFLLKGASLQEKEKDTLLLISSYMDIANLYYEQYKDHEAIPYFEKAYLLAKKTSHFELKQNATLNMAVVEENNKNLLKSLAYRKEYEMWKDSVNDQNKIWTLAQIEKKYAIDQKQKEIHLLEAENKAKIAERNSFILSSVLLLLFSFMSIYFYIQKSKSNKIILSQKESLNELNATKDKLFSIISHDLRTSVNTLRQSNTTLLKDIVNQNYDTLHLTVRKNASIATSAHNLLENLLHWATMQTNQLYFLIESVDLYSAIQQIEYNYNPLFENKNLHFENKIPKATFILADLDSLKIIIRNLLDNAIKFSKDNDTISIYTYEQNDSYQYLVIEDTGMGMNEETRTNLLKEGILLNKKKNQKGIGTGLGLQLCKSMIQKNNGKLAIESTEGMGTKIIIAFPKLIQNG